MVALPEVTAAPVGNFCDHAGVPAPNRTAKAAAIASRNGWRESKRPPVDPRIAITSPLLPTPILPCLFIRPAPLKSALGIVFSVRS
jgi:hypothetical protein